MIELLLMNLNKKELKKIKDDIKHSSMCYYLIKEGEIKCNLQPKTTKA